MSVNAELARIFDDMSKVLELTGSDPFRAMAHGKVSRILSLLPIDASTLCDDPKKLTAIDGIGQGSARRIIEYVTTGRLKEHDELVASVPPGILALLGIPGLGPKTVKLLWEKGGVVDLESLRVKLDLGELAGLPRLGEKLLANIRESIDFAAQSSVRSRLGDALPIAEAIVEHLRAVKGAKQVEYAGSLRRGCETIGDIDILASAAHPDKLGEAFRSMPSIKKVLAAGETKSSVRLQTGIQVDLRVVDDHAFGAALMYFTGSKEHNVALRERAIKRGCRLNEYGLFPDSDRIEGEGPPQKRGVKPVAASTEREIYKALDLPWIPPPLRENQGELTAKIPTLIELDDIKAELHAHTIASDGRLTIEQLAAVAKSRGFHTIAITDHSKSSVQANGLSPDRLKQHIEAVREAASRVKGITILAGSEVDILADGHLDYDDKLLAQLDIVIASPHSSLRQDPKKATARLVRAIAHPLVHILGHPTGRLINQRDGLHPDMNALIAAAVEHNTALEINAHYYRLDLRDTHVKMAVDAGALIAINTDAHIEADFDNLRYGVLTAQRGWLTADRCINAWPKGKLHAWLKKKR